MPHSLRKIKKKPKKKRDADNLTPILGVHTKWNLKIMDEIKSPFSRKEEKRLKKLQHRK